MSSIKQLCCLAACTFLLSATPAFGQHRHGHNQAVHSGGHHNVIHHHGRHFGHNDWNYVVPHYDAHHHRGSYYVQNQTHYYTPTPVIRVSSASFQSAQLPPVQIVQEPVELQFGGYARFEDLSGRLETEVNRLCLDMFYNYQHNPGFAEAYREAYSLLESAKFVHAKEHQEDRDAIRHHVTQMDQLMHHVLEEIQPWSRRHARQIASGGVIEKSSAVEAVLHHLCYDVGVEPHGADEPAPAPNTDEEQAPAPGAVINSAPPAF